MNEKNEQAKIKVSRENSLNVEIGRGAVEGRERKRERERSKFKCDVVDAVLLHICVHIV